jgi:tetratricopeptide (TPR) repeat protein
MRGFQRIHPQDLHGTRYFFEANEHVFDMLNPESYFPILAAYVNALFELGEYAKLLGHADRLIELALIENLSLEDAEEDVFTRTLFQKTYALLRLKKYDEARRLSRELLMIAPEEPRNVQLFRLVLLLRRPAYLRFLLGSGVAMGLAYTAMSAGAFLLVEPYYPEQLQWYRPLSSGFLQTAVAAVLGGSLWHHLYAFGRTAQVRRGARAKARRKTD